MSADGRRMAYAVYTERANIWTMPILEKPLSPNAPLTAVTKGAQVVEAMRLSSDGQWLLYDSTLPGRAEIYRVRLPDGVPEQLTKGRYDNFRPDLSPDGTEIVFQSFRGNSREIFVETLDGGTVQQVTSSPMQEAGPIWSPDGHSIAFGEVGGKQGAYVMRRDAAGHWGAPKTISRSWAGASDWSPDSRRVVSVVDGSVLIANVDSGVPHTIYAPRQRTSDPQMEQVVWPRNSQSLYLKSHDAEGRATFWTMSPAGGAPKLLTRLDDLSRPSNRPDFATDGKRLYFGIQDRQSDVWVAELSRP
jgi:Tol biopolymer transport system component